MPYQPGNHAPMHRRRSTPHGQEKQDTAVGDEAGHVGPEHSRKRLLCICVDDFGMHSGVDQAVLHLVGMGRVQAVGCLVGGASWQAGHSALQSLDPAQVDIGLHLDFTEFPLQFPLPRSLGALIAASLLRRLDARAVRAEIRRQLDAFEQALGRPPAFIDGHQHVHQLPVIRQALMHELRQRYSGTNLWLRSTRTSATGLSAIKPWVIECLGSRSLLSMAQKAGFGHNQRLLGVYDFQGGELRYRHLMEGWLLSAKSADLLMTHPSLPLQNNDQLMAARVAEFQVLSSHQFGAMLSTAGISLLPMSKILSSSL